MTHNDRGVESVNEATALVRTVTIGAIALAVMLLATACGEPEPAPVSIPTPTPTQASAPSERAAPPSQAAPAPASADAPTPTPQPTQAPSQQSAAPSQGLPLPGLGRTATPTPAPPSQGLPLPGLGGTPAPTPTPRVAPTAAPAQPIVVAPTPAAPVSPCSNGVIVANPDSNPGLVEDCENLLAARGTLDPSGILNWGADTAISEWDGVSLDESASRVEELALGRGQLSGSIPPEIGNLSNLTSLYLGFNQLSGSIPRELGNLSNLTWLSLSVNQLSGSIPPEIGNIDSLLWLDLSNNQLNGAIPPEIGNLDNLLELTLDGNQLSGSIPPQLAGAGNLATISLSNNQLTGDIPTALGSLDSIKSVDLSGNRLSGDVPTEFASAGSLESFRLGGNRIIGCEHYGLIIGFLDCGEQTTDDSPSAPAQPARPLCDTDADMEKCERLAHRFAPALRFHPDEKYLPRGVDAFVERATLLSSDGRDLPKDEIANAPYDSYLDVETGFAASDEFDYQPVVYAAVRGPYDAPDTPSGFETLRPRDFGGNRVYLQYHLFYYYDHLGDSGIQQKCQEIEQLRGFCSPHIADWELVQLEFDAASVDDILDQSIAPERVAYSQHSWVELKDFEDVADDDGSVVVYVAQGKHANYPEGPADRGDSRTAGTVGDLIGNGFEALPPRLSNASSPCGLEYGACAYRLTMIGDDTPWVAFAGKWGESRIEGPDKPRVWNSPHAWQFDSISNVPSLIRNLGLFEQPTPPPAAAPTESVKLASISAGGGHTCGLREDGAVECWGKR